MSDHEKRKDTTPATNEQRQRETQRRLNEALGNCDDAQSVPKKVSSVDPWPEPPVKKKGE